jgi:hypothetical protein
MNTFPTDERTRSAPPRTINEELPSAAANLVESAVMLAKAEVTLAFVRTRQVVVRSLRAAALVLVAALLLPASVVVLALGAVLQDPHAPWWNWLILVSPSLITLGIGIAAVASIRKAGSNAR